MAHGSQTIPLIDEFPDQLPRQHEIVCGILVPKAVPSYRHGVLQRRLGWFLEPFHGRRNTPGGWWTSFECQIELFARPHEERYQPDIVGWKIAAVPKEPRGTRVRAWPQWVCEILSPSTADRDRGPKLENYRRARVDHYWLIDPENQTLTILAWAEDRYRTILTAGPGDRIRAQPFAERELDLDWLFDFE